MNIFILDLDMEECAKAMVNRHIVKMPTESLQLLSTSHRMLDGNMYTTWNKRGAKMTKYYLNDGREDIIAKDCHHKHPCQIWLQKSPRNYDYLFRLTKVMCKEYTFRYGRVHGVEKRLDDIKSPPRNIGKDPFTLPPQAMDEEYRRNDLVEGYKNYYRKAKKHLAVWKNRPVPAWYNI